MILTNIKKVSQKICILAISGSLREISSNTSLLRAAIILAPENVEISFYTGLDTLPHFNPDLESTELATVTDLRAKIKWADGLLISTPEYAHGVPGVLKNMLDWLVSSFEFPGKPIALFNASPRAVHAQASLIEIVTTMSGRVIPEVCITVPLMGRNLDTEEIIADRDIADEVKRAIVRFAHAIAQLKN